MPAGPIYQQLANQCDVRKLRLELVRRQGGALELRVPLPSGGALQAGFNPSEPDDAASVILAKLALRA